MESPFWAAGCSVITPTWIKSSLEAPVDPLVVLETFISEQKLSLFGSSLKQNNIMQNLYPISKEKFGSVCLEEKDPEVLLTHACEKAKTIHFQK
jgi:hypothetical protein